MHREATTPPPHFKPMALTVNTNFQGDTITGIRDADFAKEAFQMQSGADSFNCDDILLGHGVTGFSTENLDSRLINHDDFLLVNNGGSTESVNGTIGYEMEAGTDLRSDNRFVFEPMDVMPSLGESIDPGLDAAGGFQPHEVTGVQIGNPPEPKLWLQMLG